MELSSFSIWMIILVMFIFMVIGFAVWVYTLPPPYVKSCNKRRKTNPAWNDNCLYPRAIGVQDPNMEDPSEKQLFMAGFSYSASGGLPLCLPLWYRFRYVNDISGNYSEFSQWTCSAVVAGGTNLPCLPDCSEGSCSEKISGEASCTFNRVVIGVTNDLKYGLTPNEDGSINWAVVYRYVGQADTVSDPPPEGDSVGDPLGTLKPISSSGGYTNTFTDISNNPCPEVNSKLGCYQKCPICR